MVPKKGPSSAPWQKRPDQILNIHTCTQARAQHETTGQALETYGKNNTCNLNLLYHLWPAVRILHGHEEVYIMLNSRLVIPVVAMVFVTFFFAGTLLADPPKDKGKPEKTNSEESAGKSNHDVDAHSRMVSAGISLGEARKLATQYKLTGGKPLPPGIRKNLARGKPMPPGIQKTRLPGEFIDHLPHHEGFEWQQAGTDLVLLVAGSPEIADVLNDVFD